MELARHFLFVVCTFALLAHCNTEIVNIVRPPSAEIPISVSPNWPVLSTFPGHNTKRLSILLEPPELSGQGIRKPEGSHRLHTQWVRLEIEKWREWETQGQSFTLRISWPASEPADFEVELFRPLPSLSASTRSANVLYVKIHATAKGHKHPRSGGSKIPTAVNFNIIIEPLILGFLPQSVAPILGFILMTIILSSCTVPFVTAYLSRIADLVNVEALGKRAT